MRDIDPKEPWRPLGERVTKPSNTTKSEPEWKPVEGTKGTVEQHRDGKLRTNLPLPK